MKIKIPKYTLGEEIFNAITHGIGALLGVAALVLTICFASIKHNVMGIISCSIYSVSLIIMYLISTLYHSLGRNTKAKKVFRVLDHCDIYIFIAGSYTPFCLSLIGGAQGWIIFSIVWALAIIGIILNSCFFGKFKKLSMILYLLMGWMIIFSFETIKEKMPDTGIWLLLSGGIIYTIGALLYGIGKKKKYMHSIFHICILVASILQFFSILLYAI